MGTFGIITSKDLAEFIGKEVEFEPKPTEKVKGKE